ncbi:sigma factor [Streptomyces sp. TRM70350]|uniref:sigma factor n=1 Tax=Streptomyces sp. TRM70350 TaxID=2856165 RepID=UPI0027E16AB8|nr:sigma factor [Streptomyces sp. TRM70350]
MSDQDFPAERFEAHRRHLRAVAPRMLGSRAEADDAVQEAWFRRPVPGRGRTRPGRHHRPDPEHGALLVRRRRRGGECRARRRRTRIWRGGGRSSTPSWPPRGPGDFDGLLQVLAPDVVARDGGHCDHRCDRGRLRRAARAAHVASGATRAAHLARASRPALVDGVPGPGMFWRRRAAAGVGAAVHTHAAHSARTP